MRNWQSDTWKDMDSNMGECSDSIGRFCTQVWKDMDSNIMGECSDSIGRLFCTGE